MPRASIKDVAKAANVSIATVSHVINNSKPVTPETREAVEKAIKDLDYRINFAARSMKTGKSNLIAIIVPDVSNPVFSSIIDTAEEIISKRGYRFVVSMTKDDPEKEAESIRAFSGGLVDGLIIASGAQTFDGLLKDNIPKDMPCIFIDRRIENNPYDTVIFNYTTSVTDATQHLIDKGHKKIGYITGLMQLSNTQDRFNAFLKTISLNGLYQGSLIKIGDSQTGPVVEKELEDLIQAGATAIIVAGNKRTREAVRIIAEKHITGIEIVGFEGSNIYIPSTTTIDIIHQPTAEFGKVAAKLILDKIDGKESKSKVVEIPCEFIARD